jgi:hypothetical protein
VVGPDRQLVLGEDHPRRRDAAQLRAAERAAVGHDRARAGDRDELARRHVRRAADDLRLLAAADVDDADRQAVGVGVRLRRQHAPDDEVVQLPHTVVLDAVDLGAGHRQLRRELLDRQVGLAVLLQPRDGNLHPNWSRKRTSLS